MVLLAKRLLVMLLVVLAAMIGAVVSFFGIYTLARLTGVSNINGGLAMGAAGLAPFGAVIAALLGLWRGIRWVGSHHGRDRPGHRLRQQRADPAGGRRLVGP